MSNSLTDDQINRLIGALQKAKGEQLQDVLASKSSFVIWVEKIGLSVLAHKIANLAAPLWDKLWDAITSFFEYVGEQLDGVIDWIAEFLSEAFSS